MQISLRPYFPFKATAPLLLSTLLSGCHSPRTAASSHPQQPLPQVHAGHVAQSASMPQTATDEVLRGDDAKILVFPDCASYPRGDLGDPKVSVDELIELVKDCRMEVVYELARPLSEGRFQIFNDGEITDEYPLPELSAGRHITGLPRVFYWREDHETFPDQMISCNLGKISTSMGSGDLWSSRVEKSAYEYKPAPRGERSEDPTADMAASLQGEEMGFTLFSIPGLQNLKGRLSGQLPEVELLGVGFVEGTPIQCGRGETLDMGKSPLRDVRVISTAEHDLQPDYIQVLKAARFAIPTEIFDYPNHIRIVGRFK